MVPDDAFTQLAQPWVETYVTEAPKGISPGDKVICIDAKGLRRVYDPGPPVEGHLYCVREVYIDQDQVGLLLIGIRGPAFGDNLECGFLARRFRWVHD